MHSQNKFTSSAIRREMSSQGTAEIDVLGTLSFWERRPRQKVRLCTRRVYEFLEGWRRSKPSHRPLHALWSVMFPVVLLRLVGLSGSLRELARCLSCSARFAASIANEGLMRGSLETPIKTISTLATLLLVNHNLGCPQIPC